MATLTNNANKNYSVVAENGKSSRGLRRFFNIPALGFTPEQVENILLARAAAGQLFIPGTLVEGCFEGEINSLYAGNVSVEDAATALAEQFGGESEVSFPTNGWKITVGLKEGYGESGTLHTINELLPLIPAEASLREGVVVYAWPKSQWGEAGCGSEQQAIIEGEGLDENEVNELAATLGGQTGQTRVYVCYGSEAWILQAEETSTPTGETV